MHVIYIYIYIYIYGNRQRWGRRGAASRGALGPAWGLQMVRWWPLLWKSLKNYVHALGRLLALWRSESLWCSLVALCALAVALAELYVVSLLGAKTELSEGRGLVAWSSAICFLPMLGCLYSLGETARLLVKRQVRVRHWAWHRWHIRLLSEVEDFVQTS